MQAAKSVLIDLYMTKYPNCGFGQVALNYGRYFRDVYQRQEDMEIYLLVPPGQEGVFGSQVQYLSSVWWKKFIPQGYPYMDLWHSIQQMPRFMPYSPRTCYLLTVHDFNYEYEKKGAALLHDRNRLQKLIQRADQLACISQFTRQEFDRYCPGLSAPITVIPNGVETFDVSIAQRPAQVPAQEKFLFSIGELRAKKNFHVLLDMMKLLPDKKLYVAGGKVSEYGQLLENRIRKEHINNVVLLGRIRNEERIWLYAHCEAFVFPSLFEGFGLPVVEAMQFGKPVFSSDKTSLKEIGGECAVFWTHFAPEYMAASLCRGLEEFAAHPQWVQRNKDYAATFSYTRHLEAYLHLYRRLLGLA